MYEKSEILRLYEEIGQVMYYATLDGDYETNNKEGQKLVEIFKYFEKNKELANCCIMDMFRSKNVVVRTKAAAYCLALNENIEMAQKVLMEISNKKENGIFAFNAKMTLEVWRKQGYLKIYQNEE